MAQYSALFTLGLLSYPNRSPSPSSEDRSSQPSTSSNQPELSSSFLSLDQHRSDSVPQTLPSPARSYLSLASSSSARSRSRSRRPSRDKLPLPKPAPSTSLPALPSPTPVSAPVRTMSLPSPTTAPAIPRFAAHSHSHSVSSALTTATSVRTVRKQTAHRDAALADLEGRGASPRRPASRRRSRPLRRNFISLSDDESDSDADTEVDEVAEKVVRRDTVSLCLMPAPAPPPEQQPAQRRRRSTVAALLMPSRSRKSSSGAVKAKNGALSAATWFASFLDLDLRDDDRDGPSRILAARAA